MPDVNQYTFKHKELLEMLVRRAGLREGRWRLIVNFGFSAGNFGPSEKEVFPGVAMMMNWVGLEKADANSPPSLTIDAAEVNPASAASAVKQRPSARSKRGKPGS